MRELKVILGWMRGYRLKLMGALLATGIAIVFSTLIPLVTQTAIDQVIGQSELAKPSFISEFVSQVGDVKAQLMMCGGFVICFTCLNAIFSFLKAKWSAQASENFAKVLKDKMYDHIQQLPYHYLKHVETGDLIQRCSSDVETIRRFLGMQLVEMGYAVLMFIIIFSFMLSLNVKYALVSVSLVPVLFGFCFLFFKRVKSTFKVADEAEASMSTMLQENLSGVRVVRAYCNQEFEIEQFEKKNRAFKDSSYRVSKISALFWGSSDFLCFAQIALVVIFGGYLTIIDEISIGTLQAFISYEYMIIWPVRQLGRILTDFGKTTIATRRILEILEEPVEFNENEVKPEIKGAITFDKVCFEYDDHDRVLKDVSFTVNKGETVAIIGRTGSGKTTLVNLLLRLYDYNSGSIKIDGVELNTIDKKWIRHHVGVVLQEMFLYTKTIKQNIAMPKKQATDEQIYEVAQVASVHRVIQDFKEGYNTVVGERGVTLSGGQKQRVGIARALMKECPIVVFDDSLSAVDTETDVAIRKALAKRSREMTSFIIAHRVSTVKDADKIIVLDQGHIVQMGNHDELIRQDGLYKTFWEIQNRNEQEVLELINEGLN